MYSAASAFTAGVMQWSVAHDAQQGLRHLHTEGMPPITLETIRESLGRELENQPSDENLVDFLFDAPIELAAQTTGYRHDHWEFDWGRPHFTELAAAPLAKPMRGFFAKIEKLLRKR